jgi:hypothetical protein
MNTNLKVDVPPLLTSLVRRTGLSITAVILTARLVRIPRFESLKAAEARSFDWDISHLHGKVKCLFNNVRLRLTAQAPKAFMIPMQRPNIDAMLVCSSDRVPRSSAYVWAASLQQ